MAGNSESMTFLPGTEPGPYALGLPNHPDVLDKLAAYKLRLKRMPVGGAVSAEFPWIRNVRETLVGGDRIIIRRNANWQTTFQNTSDHPVKVHEVRFRNDYSPGSVEDWQTALQVRMDIPDRKVINAELLPVNTFSTEIDRYLNADLDYFCFELPTPYVLQRGNPFLLDVLYNAAFAIGGSVDVRDWVIEAGLHGWGLQDGEPIALMKPIRSWDFTAAVAGQYQTVAFDDEQQRPMRDAIITHMTFGTGTLTTVAGTLAGIEVRPVAPEGPSWHQGEFFHLFDIGEQVGERGQVGRYCIHRPIVPYTLEKGEGLRIELLNTSVTTVNVSITLRGTQEGR